MKQSIFIFLFIFTLSCSGGFGTFCSSTADTAQAIDSLWANMIQIDGCLVGEQYKTGRFERHTYLSVLYNNRKRTGSVCTSKDPPEKLVRLSAIPGIQR